MDITEITDKGDSWNQIVDSENITAKDKECPSKTELLADKFAKGKLTSPSVSKFTKSINKLNSAKLKMEPNLSTVMKRRTKIDLNSNIKKKEVLDESLENKIRQLTLENQKLKLLLEETDRKNKEIKQRQVMQSAGQDTPDISTKNRFEILKEESLSTMQVMEAEMAEEEEKSFVQILKDKNNRKTNNNSQPLNYTQANMRSSNTHINSQISEGHNIFTNNRENKAIGNPSSSQQKRKKPPPIIIFSQDPRDTWKLAREIMAGANFHIKRVNENKHILQIDNIDVKVIPITVVS